jgi:hypothetical protein
MAGKALIIFRGDGKIYDITVRDINTDPIDISRLYNKNDG